MPARKKPYHMYTVFVDTERTSTMAYFGSSEATARSAFARAVMNNPHASSVEIRRDLKPWLRITIERS